LAEERNTAQTTSSGQRGHHAVKGAGRNGELVGPTEGQGGKTVSGQGKAVGS